MINHLRTCLLNEPGEISQDWQIPGEEYIPEEYNKKLITEPFIKNIHNIFFPEYSDKAYKNLMAFSLLRIIHFSDLEPYAFIKDKRITYLENLKNDFIRNYEIYPQKRFKVIGLVDRKLNVINDLKKINSTKNIQWKWKISIINDNFYIQCIKPSSYKNLQESIPLTFTDGISQPINLLGLPIKITLTNGPDEEFFIEFNSNFKLDFEEIFNHLTGLTAEEEDELFKNFKKLKFFWKNSDDTFKKLGSLCVALAYYIDKNF